MSQGVTPSPQGAGFQVRTHNLIGGSIVALFGLALLGYGFYVPNTTIPKLMAAAVAVIGVVVAVGILPAQSPPEFYGGQGPEQSTTPAFVAPAVPARQPGLSFCPAAPPRRL